MQKFKAQDFGVHIFLEKRAPKFVQLTSAGFKFMALSFKILPVKANRHVKGGCNYFNKLMKIDFFLLKKYHG